MRLRDSTIGSLNLLRTRPEALAESDLDAAQALADVATIGLIQQRAAEDARLLTEQLQTALDSRIVIEQAKGVLAEHRGLSMTEAFAALRAYARARQARLSDVAAGVAGREPGLVERVAAAAPRLRRLNPRLTPTGVSPSPIGPYRPVCTRLASSPAVGRADGPSSWSGGRADDRPSGPVVSRRAPRSRAARIGPGEFRTIGRFRPVGVG